MKQMKASIITKAQLIFIFLFCTLNIINGQNIKDSIQTFKISETLEYSYKKPKFFDIFRYIPNDLAEFGKFTVQKENLL